MGAVCGALAVVAEAGTPEVNGAVLSGTAAPSCVGADCIAEAEEQGGVEGTAAVEGVEGAEKFKIPSGCGEEWVPIAEGGTDEADWALGWLPAGRAASETTMGWDWTRDGDDRLREG